MATSMEVRFLFVFMAFTPWIITDSQIVPRSVSGSISDDVTIVHKAVPVPPSSNMIVGMDISYPEKLFREWSDYPMIGLNTTEDHGNIKTQCIHSQYGQLGKNDSYLGLLMDESLSGYLRCELCFVQNTKMLHCKGDITVELYRASHIFFSVGYLCDHIPSESSLKGLHYKITISGTNDTVCLPFIFDSWSYDDDMQLRLLPNLLGQDNNLTFFTLLESTSLCYPDVAEFLCYAFVLNEIDLNEIYPHCTNSSDDYLNGCGPRQGNRKFMNCPSLTEDFLCLYEPAGCKVSPPSVKNAKISTAYTMGNGYVLHGEAEYTCNEGFKMEGNKTISCMYNKSWSTPPKCCRDPTVVEFITETTATSTMHYIVVVLLLTLLVMVFVILAVRYRSKLKKARQLEKKCDTKLNETSKSNVQEENMGLEVSTSTSKRRRPFDATIFYHFDTDDGFVINQLLPELEKKRDFKICFHSRNFVPGRDIKDNIEEAIEGSNSAIIIMSQGFVDSMWCKEEFTHCYIENMKDESFNLFVIMMQPVDTLINISNYMKTFFANKTY